MFNLRIGSFVSVLAFAVADVCAQTGEIAPVSDGKIITIDVQEGTSMAVSVSPDGKSLLMDLQGSLWILPSAGGAAKRLTDYYNDAHQPVWSPDGKTIAYYAFRDGGYHLWMISADGSDRRQITNGPYDDRELAWSPDGKRVVFASDRSGKGPASYNIWMLEISTGEIRQITSGNDDGRMPGWSPDGKELVYAATTAQGSELRRVSLADGKETVIRQSPEKLSAPSWGYDNQIAYVYSDENVSRLEIDGKPVSGDENVFPFPVSWLKGKNAYYYVSDGKIRHRSENKKKTIEFTARLEVNQISYPRAKRDFNSTEPRKALGIMQPAISPDGNKIAFAALNDIYVMSTKEGKPENLTSDLAMDTYPAWSPDGNQLVYSSDKAGGLPQLWIRDLKTGKDRQLTSMTTQPLASDWSPDGKYIAFIDVDGRWSVAGLAVVEVATGKVTRLQTGLSQPGKPSWSADGAHIAVSLPLRYSNNYREGTNQIFVVPVDIVEKPFWQVPQPNVSIDIRNGGGPVWSPDGLKMAAVYDGVLKIWQVGPDGAPLDAPRAYNSEITYYPSWTADSKKIVYISSDALRSLDIESGEIETIPLHLTYKPAIPSGQKLIHVSNLVDAVQDKTQHDKDIIVDGNRIARIVDHDPALHSTIDDVVDATGLTAVPGFIEHHAHSQKDFGADAHRAWLAYGVTTVRDPGNPPYDSVEDREAAESGARIGPRIFATGPLLEWRRTYYKMGMAISGPAHLERELDRARILKYDLLKSYVRMPDIFQRRIVEAGHEMGISVGTHEIYPAAYTGVDVTDHIGATSRRGFSMKQGPLGRIYDDVVKVFGASKRYLTPTNFGAINSFLIKNPEFRSDPRIAMYPKWAQDSIYSAGLSPASVTSATIAQGKAIKDIFDAGGQIVAGTDSVFAINLHAEISSYVDAGMSPFDALRSVTAVPAQSLNIEAGTLENGKIADIVLLEGNPLDNIANTMRVKKVVANGRVFDAKDLTGIKSYLTGN